MKKNFFEKVSLFFGRDIVFSRWLKQHQGNTVQEIIAQMSDEEIEKAREFIYSRPFKEIKHWGLAPDEYVPVDARAEACLSEIEEQKRIRAEQKRKAEIAAIDWSSVRKEDLELVVVDVPEHQEEESFDWHKKGMVTIRRHYSFELVLNHAGKRFELPGSFNLMPDLTLKNGKEFLQRHNIYLSLPSNCLHIVRQALGEKSVSAEMQSLLQIYAYNWCVNQRLAKEKAAAAEKIKKEHIKEKIRYRLKHNYGK